MKEVYKDVEDIDLFIGVLSEFEESRDSIVGTTIRCILADQFLRLKKGDRFYYERQELKSSFSRGKNDEKCLSK